MQFDIDVGYSYILDYFEGYDYHCPLSGMAERMDYRRPDNITGHQQRAFILYWAIDAIKSGYVGVELGAAVDNTPGCIDVDRYDDDVNPPVGRSDGHKPGICADACDLSILRSGKYGNVISNNVWEHLDDPYKAAKEAFRIMRPGRYFAMIVPDASVQEWNAPDERHVTAWLPRRGDRIHPFDGGKVGFPEGVIYLDEFAQWLRDYLKAEIVEMNNLNNHFSLNLVARKEQR